MQAAAEPLFTWHEVALEYAGFLSSFALLGAAGFWLALARPDLRDAASNAPMARAARTAARIGLFGAVVGALVMATNVAVRAAEKGQSFAAAAVRGGAPLAVGAVLLALLLVLFALLAASRARGAWGVAVACVVALTLRNVVTGRWQTLVNPLHVLGGGLWIGTLGVLVIAVLPLAFRGELAGRGGESSGVAAPSLVELVARFSRLSLAAASLLVASGLVTAWRRLKYPAALWTTPYGLALLTKLAVVAVVFSLGAFNWKRVSPGLASEGGAARLRRSARAELGTAAVVLAITALLISLPAPKAPKPPAPVAAAGVAH